jgi:hypothetical protein
MPLHCEQSTQKAALRMQVTQRVFTSSGLFSMPVMRYERYIEFIMFAADVKGIWLCAGDYEDK